MTTATLDSEKAVELLARLRAEAANAATDEEAQAITTQVLALVRRIKRERGLTAAAQVPTLTEHVRAVDRAYVMRPHLAYLITRLEKAVADVEAGHSRWLRISMPPRMGKTDLTTIKFPTWLLRKHPDWHFGLMSHGRPLATSWGREIRRQITAHPEWEVQIAKDAGAVTDWETVNGGHVLSRSVGETIAGVGFKVLIADDVIGDAADAASPTKRDTLWQKWVTDMLGRREAPTLYIVIGTRYHEDDLIGRLMDPVYERHTDRWEVIEFPAIAEHDDVLGRAPGEPLISPLLDETPEEAVERWRETEEQVGSYAWTALYQQSPSPANGDIFNGDWWRFWTINPANATEDGRVVHIDATTLAGRWLDSWDLAFKGTDSSDFVVGQRWVERAPHKYLVGQARARMDFVQTLNVMRAWSEPDSVSGTGRHVYERLVEDAANGPAVIATLRDEISGLVPIPAWGPKPARARAVAPDVEGGNVFLPFPGDPGNEWVADLLAEIAAFPHGRHDDAVDALTQALNRLRGKKPTGSAITNPNRTGRSIPQGLRGQNRVREAASAQRRMLGR